MSGLYGCLVLLFHCPIFFPSLQLCFPSPPLVVNVLSSVCQITVFPRLGPISKYCWCFTSPLCLMDLCRFGFRPHSDSDCLLIGLILGDDSCVWSHLSFWRSHELHHCKNYQHLMTWIEGGTPDLYISSPSKWPCVKQSVNQDQKQASAFCMRFREYNVTILFHGHVFGALFF